MLEWLRTGANAAMYLNGNKANACKQIAEHLQEQKVSPDGIYRNWESIKQRLLVMLKKYYVALRKKNQTGWGSRNSSTVKGSQFENIIYYMFGFDIEYILLFRCSRETLSSF